MAGFLFVLSVCRSAIYLRYMRKEQVISGAEAIRRMRLISKMKDETFTLIHFTCNMKTGVGGELRKVEHCRLRPAMPGESYKGGSGSLSYLHDIGYRRTPDVLEKVASVCRVSSSIRVVKSRLVY